VDIARPFGDKPTPDHDPRSDSDGEEDQQEKSTREARQEARDPDARPESGEEAPPKAPPQKGDAAAGGRETADASAALAKLRKQIDRLDHRIVALLNERAGAVVEIGSLKRGSGTPIYAPHREAEVLARALGANQGPLPDRTIEGIYREMMSGSFALEQPLRIGYLGPPGSQSHVAAVKQFGSSVEYDDLHEIGGVFTEVRRGHVNYGLVPIENSTGGGIAEAMDAFRAPRATCGSTRRCRSRSTTRCSPTARPPTSAGCTPSPRSSPSAGAG
jgi:chorismate mutase-like protein